jgi:hypothetical protein
MAQDPEEAQQWLEAQPAEVKGDRLYTETANQLQWRSNFAEAAQWAGRIDDQTARETTLREIYGGWNRNDSEAAQEWLQVQDEAIRAAVESAPQPAEEGVAPGFVPSPQEVQP